jgi:hypothetical protein
VRSLGDDIVDHKNGAMIAELFGSYSSEPV